jgi:hypothetical protein
VRAVSRSGRVTPTSGSLESHIGVSGPVRERRTPRPLDKPSDTQGSRSRLRSPGTLLLLGVALVVVLGLVAAVSRAHDTPGGRSGIHSPPSGVGDYVFTIFAIVLVGTAAVLIYFWISEREALAALHRRGGKKGTYRALVFVLIIGLTAAIVTRTGGLHLFNRGTSETQKQIGGQRAPSPKKKPRGPNVSQPPHFEWLPVIIAGGAGFAILGFVGMRTLRRERGLLLEQYLLERQFESLLDETLDDLYANADPRASIIAAYARMEQLFASAGLPRHPHEAPLEYLGRALGELRASGAALGRLTGLFQRAKFSSHEVDESMRTEAIEALTQVRDELRAKREEDRLYREQAEEFRRTRTDQLDDAPASEDPFAAAADKARGSIYSGGRY